MGKVLETARGALRRTRDEATIWDSPTHLSISLDQSREWFRKQVELQMQRGGLFEDPFFCADHSGIGSGLRGTYEWLRPQVCLCWQMEPQLLHSQH